MHKEFNFSDLEKRYEAMTARVQATCRLSTSLVGGQPGSEDGVRAYVTHRMKVPADHIEATVKDIMAHEIPGGYRRLPIPEGGELEDSETKSVNLIRRDEYGPWLGDWMVKACIKNAASRIGLFGDTKGTKGDMTEMGQVKAFGSSLHEVDGRVNSNRIYLRYGNGPAPTSLEFFRGSVSSPQGRKSIVTLSEVCDVGAEFAFEFRFFNGKTLDDDIVNIFASAMIIGLGSGRSFERGKFRIEKLIVERGEKLAKKRADLKVKLKAAEEHAEVLIPNGSDHSDSLPVA